MHSKVDTYADLDGPGGETWPAVPSRGTSSGGPRHAWIISTVALCAVVVRAIHVIETRGVPFARQLIGDAAAYYQWASEIAGGDWLGTEAFYQAPLYPYVLAVCFKLAGTEVWVVRLVQALWSGAAVVCLWYGTSRMFGRRVGMISALMLAFYGPAVFFDGVVQKASLACLLVTLLTAGMAACEARAGAWRTFPVGVVGGLLVVTRENAMVWLPIVGLWVWVTGRERAKSVRLRSVGVYALGVALILLPVGVRNHVVSGEWSLSTFQSGPNFYIGNHKGANGLYQPLVRGHETPVFERKDATLLAERALGRELGAKEVSDYWWSRSLMDIQADPAWWAGLMGRKLLTVWNRYEVADAESQYVCEHYSSALYVLGSVWHFGVLCPLAVVGVVCTWGRRRRLWIHHALIVSMAFAIALFYVTARYRFPLVPLLIPFAAAGVLELWRLARSGDYRRLWERAVVAGIVAGVVNWPIHDESRLDAMAWMNVGVALAQEGDVVGATEYFHKAVRGNPQSAEANNNLAQALALQGDYAGAIPHYQAALAAEPGLAGVDFNLAVALERVGRVGEAISHYERAVDVDPSDADAREAINRLGRYTP